MKEIVSGFQKLLALTCALGQLKSLCLRGNWELCSQMTDDLSTTTNTVRLGPVLLSVPI